MSRPDPVGRTLAAAALATASWVGYCAWRGDERVAAWTRTTVEDLFSQKRAIEPRVDDLGAALARLDETLRDTVDGLDRLTEWARTTDLRIKGNVGQPTVPDPVADPIWHAAAAWLDANTGLHSSDLGRREIAGKLDDHPHPSIRPTSPDQASAALFDEVNTAHHPANRTSAYR